MGPGFLRLFLMFILPLFCARFVFPQEKGSFTDPRDHKVYGWAKIGNQCWMTKNMDYQTREGCWSYNNISDAGKKYGKLYTWDQAMKACPKGWRLPADSEWTVLVEFLGGQNLAGGKLKQAGTDSWADPNVYGINDGGFTALAGGYRHFSDHFSEITTNAYFWTSTPTDEMSSFYRCLVYNKATIFRYSGDNRMGFSVRCIRNK
jgi:uncharacterized protein (TIGR02145 family)